MNIICEIEANPASDYCGTEPYVNGQTDGRTDERADDTRQTKIFGRIIKTGKH